MCFLSISFEICFVSFSKTNYPNHSNVVLLLGYLLQMAISKLPLPPTPHPPPPGKLVNLSIYICYELFLPYYFLHSMSCISMPYSSFSSLPFKNIDRVFWLVFLFDFSNSTGELEQIQILTPLLNNTRTPSFSSPPPNVHAIFVQYF